MTSRRDAIMDALMAYLEAGCGNTFRTYSRRFRTWEQVVQDSGSRMLVRQPALYLFDGVGLGGGSDNFNPKGKGSPGLVTMARTIVIYARLPGGGTAGGPDNTTPGGTVFYPLLEAVENTLATRDDDQQNCLTLGGLVSHCWLEGDGLIMTGEIDDQQGQGMLTMPVRMLMYPFSQ